MHVMVPGTQKEHNKRYVKCMPSLHLAPLSTVLQAMRFPPKSYNKDLESAEVRCFCLAKTERSNFPTEMEEGGGFWKGWEQL